jgi:hypothetical protein
MASETQHYGLTKLGPGEGLHAGGGRFPSADRDTIDQVLYLAANHVHTGAAFTSNAPTTAPTLTLSTSGGTLPAGTTIRYAYTYTDPESGETTISPVATVATAAQITAPAAPTFSLQSTGGALPPGEYFYVLSAYQGTTTVETKALNPVTVTIPAGSAENVVELTMPALPPGATGFNIYRRPPNTTAYHHIAFTTAATFNDTGGDLGINTTNGTNQVTVSIASVPVDNLWTLYRSYTTSFDNTLLVTQDEFDLNYVDTGAGTSLGTPPSQALAVGTPSQIDLTTNVQGVLPLANGGTGGTDAPTARTSLGAAADVEVVKLTGDQTVAGIKTFSASPVAPTPTTASQVVIKSYADALPRGYYDIITHGATAGTVRTVGIATNGTEPILWRGSVEPTNAVDGDDWLVTV